MKDTDLNHKGGHRRKWSQLGFIFLSFVIVVGAYLYVQSNKEPQSVIKDHTVANIQIENGIHVPTGLKDGEGLMTVVANCTACHSAQLIIQNRMDEERWNATIRWMQETQNLWELGDQQEVIVNYLVENYPVNSKGRRGKLENIEWYELTD